MRIDFDSMAKESIINKEELSMFDESLQIDHQAEKSLSGENKVSEKNEVVKPNVK